LRSRRSAEAILPIVLDLTSAARVIDVGCGTGSWLAVAQELGVRDVLGIDGAYGDRTLLEIPEDRFVAHDLTRPIELAERFDLALSTEVAEHLPLGSADAFVESLTRLAPLVLFSAAVPFQGGQHHLNEQWQDWWAERFATQGFRVVDCVRPRIWSDTRVAYFYAQNVILYASEEALEENDRLARASEASQLPLRLVHPELYETTVKRFPPRSEIEARRLGRKALKALVELPRNRHGR
jgi:SAM-dependent methyltransferase